MEQLERRESEAPPPPPPPPPPHGESDVPLPPPIVHMRRGLSQMQEVDFFNDDFLVEGVMTQVFVTNAAPLPAFNLHMRRGMSDINEAHILHDEQMLPNFVPVEAAASLPLSSAATPSPFAAASTAAPPAAACIVPPGSDMPPPSMLSPSARAFVEQRRAESGNADSHNETSSAPSTAAPPQRPSLFSFSAFAPNLPPPLSVPDAAASPAADSSSVLHLHKRAHSAAQVNAERAPPQAPVNPFDSSERLGDVGDIRALLDKCFALRSGFLALRVRPSSGSWTFKSWQPYWFYLNHHELLFVKGGAAAPFGSFDLARAKQITTVADATEAHQAKKQHARSGSEDRPELTIKRHLSKASEIVAYMPRIVDLLDAGRLFEAHRLLVELQHGGRQFGCADVDCTTAHPRFEAAIGADGRALPALPYTPVDHDIDCEDTVETEVSLCLEFHMPDKAEVYQLKAATTRAANEWLEALQMNNALGQAMRALNLDEAAGGAGPAAPPLVALQSEFATLASSSKPADRELAHRLIAAKQTFASPKHAKPLANVVAPRPPIVRNAEMAIQMFEMFAMARTGDVVLFCSKGIGSAYLRSTIAGEYDHIGLVVRYGHGKLGILESLPDTGVTVFDWNEFLALQTWTQYSRVAVRFLEHELEPVQLYMLQSFLRSAVGSKHQELQFEFRRQRSAFDPVAADLGGSSSAAAVAVPTKYSCSQLVAKAYKRMGLLRGNLSASLYNPGDFAESSRLRLLANAFSPEFGVQFEDLPPAMTRMMRFSSETATVQADARASGSAPYVQPVLSTLASSLTSNSLFAVASHAEAVIRVDGAADMTGRPSFTMRIPTLVCDAIERPTEAGEWIADELAPVCMLCTVSVFGMTLRRHHCRNCGIVVCHSCAPRSLPLPHIVGASFASMPQKVCVSCEQIILLRARGGRPETLLAFANAEMQPLRMLSVQQLRWNLAHAHEKHDVARLLQHAMRLHAGHFAVVSLLEGNEASATPTAGELNRLRLLLLHDGVVAISAPLPARMTSKAMVPLRFALLSGIDDIEALEFVSSSSASVSSSASSLAFAADAAASGFDVASTPVLRMRFSASSSRAASLSWRLAVHSPCSVWAGRASLPANAPWGGADIAPEIEVEFERLESEINEMRVTDARSASAAKNTCFNEVHDKHGDSSAGAGGGGGNQEDGDAPLALKHHQSSSSSHANPLTSTDLFLLTNSRHPTFARLATFTKVATKLPGLQFESLDALCDFAARECVATVDALQRHARAAVQQEVERVIAYHRTAQIAVSWDVHPAHVKLLQRLWYTTAADGGSHAFPGVPSEQWKSLGFQGVDPQTDFRGMGALGLACVCDFALHNAPLVRDYVRLTSGGAGGVSRDAKSHLGEAREYPLAVAVINFCALLGELLEWKAYAHIADRIDADDEAATAALEVVEAVAAPAKNYFARVVLAQGAKRSVGDGGGGGGGRGNDGGGGTSCAGDVAAASIPRAHLDAPSSPALGAAAGAAATAQAYLRDKTNAGNASAPAASAPVLRASAPALPPRAPASSVAALKAKAAENNIAPPPLVRARTGTKVMQAMSSDSSATHHSALSSASASVSALTASAPARTLLHLMATSDAAACARAFEAMLDTLIKMFDRMWLDSNAGYMDFSYIAAEVRRRVVEALDARPLSMRALERRLLQDAVSVTPRWLAEQKSGTVLNVQLRK